MHNIPLQQLLTRKSLIIGLTIIILTSVILLVRNASEETPQTISQQPTPTVDAIENTEATQTPIPPDRQIEGQVVVKFGTSATQAQINTFLEKYNASILSEIEGINYTVLKVPNGQENTIIEQMRNEPLIEDVQGDYTNHLMYIPNDSDFSLQYGLKNTGQTIKNVVGTANADIKAEAAWDVTRGNGIKIAVLDTGINLTHPDLSAKIVAQRSFTTQTVEDQAGHGTHVAGIIAASTNNGQGIAGTCPECQLIIGKVMGDNGSGATSTIASGITWAADQGAKVINLSLGSTQQSSASLYQTAIDYAVGKGAVVVVSSGNCGGTNFASNGCTARNQITYPGANTNVVTVASTDNRDALSTFSNHGSHVEVTAPGTNIYSTFPNHANAKNVLNYGYLSGTSMAAPMTAGVLGLIWASPYGTSPTAVINRLYATVDPIAGTGTYWSKGRINAAKAVGAGTATAAPTVGSISPTFVCAGSPAGSVCPPTTVPNITILPSSATGGGGQNPSTGQPSIPVGGVNPTSANPTPVVQPCINDSISSTLNHKSRGKAGGGFIERFMRFLFQLIEFFLRMIGVQIPGNPNPGGNPIPTQPPGGGNPIPCPQPTTPVVQPTTVPTTVATQPSVAQPTTAQPTTTQPQPTTAAGEMPAITVSGNKIQRGGQDWWFVGYNSFVWSGDCGTNSEKMSAAQVDAWFDTMRTDGHGAVRVYFWQGWDINRLDQLVASAKKRNIYVTITVEEAMGYCGRTKVDDGWFTQQNKDSYKNHMSMLLNRYKGNTTIAWFEYFNEPGYHGGKLRQFFDEMGAHANTIDPNRLFSSGTVAPYWLGSEANFKNVHESPGVDIASLHEYDGGEVESNHGPKARANSAGKPVIVGEAGYQRMKPWEGCDSDVAGIVNRVRGKSQAYKTDGYAGVFFWAWQPGSNCGKGLDKLTEVHNLLKTIN